MLEPGLYLGALLLALLAWAFMPRPSMTMVLVLAILIPPLFIRTGRRVVDRFVGELSFGIYLTHYPIYLLLAQHLEPRLTGALTAVLAILAAIVLCLLRPAARPLASGAGAGKSRRPPGIGRHRREPGLMSAVAGPPLRLG